MTKGFYLNDTTYEIEINQISVSRNGNSINPLDAMNFTNGEVYKNDESIMINEIDHDEYLEKIISTVNSQPDMQIVDGVMYKIETINSNNLRNMGFFKPNIINIKK